MAEALAGQWAAALPSLPPPAAVTGPAAERVEALLCRAARLDGGDLERLQVVADAERGGGHGRGVGAAGVGTGGAVGTRGTARTPAWAPAMHAATWASHLADRLHPAAVAQLRLVERVHGSVPVEPLARGCWSALSGAVQAEVVADVLDAETHDALAGGTLLALGLPG